MPRFPISQTPPFKTIQVITEVEQTRVSKELLEALHQGVLTGRVLPAPLKGSVSVTRGVRMEVVRRAIRAREPDENPAGLQVHPETAIQRISVMARTESLLIQSIAVPQMILIETLVIQIQETSLWRKTFLVIPSLHAIFRSEIISNTDPGTRNM
jgi:hypothetical protein